VRQARNAAIHDRASASVSSERNALRCLPQMEDAATGAENVNVEVPKP